MEKYSRQVTVKEILDMYDNNPEAYFMDNSRTVNNYEIGPWWWSSGQRARLLLRWSEFESRWGLQFFCKIVIEKNENKQKKRPGLAHF